MPLTAQTTSFGLETGFTSSLGMDRWSRNSARNVSARIRRVLEMIPAPATSRSRSNRVNDALSPYEHKKITIAVKGDNILQLPCSLRIELLSLRRRVSTSMMRA